MASFKGASVRSTPENVLVEDGGTRLSRRLDDVRIPRRTHFIAPSIQTPAQITSDVVCLANEPSSARRRDDQNKQRVFGPPTPPAQADEVTSGKTPLLVIGERQRRLYPLDPVAIDYIEADRNYVTFWVGATEYLRRDTIKRLSTVLNNCGFVRIDRSNLINIRAIAYAQIAARRTFVFTLYSGACLHSSAAYRDAILRILPLAPAPTR